jgi:hypothetical protein
MMRITSMMLLMMNRIKLKDKIYINCQTTEQLLLQPMLT